MSRTRRSELIRLPDSPAWRYAIALGSWCGYVGVTRGHPFFEKPYQDIDDKIQVHGGLTFADKCSPIEKEHGICHIVETGEDDNVWWLGFDCGHAFDIAPGMIEFLRSAANYGTYKNLEYVQGQIKDLAKQLWAFDLEKKT